MKPTPSNPPRRLGPDLFQIDSSSVEGVTYTLVNDPEDGIRCDCPAGRHGNLCKHAREVQALLDREAEAATPPPTLGAKLGEALLALSERAAIEHPGGRLYTARYANKAVGKAGYVPVRTSLGGPKFPIDYPLDETLPEITPEYWMLKLHDQDTYRVAYRKKLDLLGVPKIQARLDAIIRRHPGADIVLLCFEDVSRPGQWCHRSMFAQWWLERTGEVIEELPDDTAEAAKREFQAQLSMWHAE